MNRALLVGTDDGIQMIGADLPRMPAGRSITHIVTSSQGVWALADGTTVWHDAGRGDGRPVASVDDGAANCLLATGDGVLVGAGEARLLELRDARFRTVASFEGAPGRSYWYTPWGGPPDVRSIAKGVEGNLYVNVHVGGVVRSRDGGHTWSPTMDIDVDVHQVVADPVRPHHAYVAAAIGLGITTDGGDTWTFTAAGLHGSYCRAVAVSEAAILVSASAGPSGRHAALYRRVRDSEAPLSRCRNGLPERFSTNLDTFCLAAAGGTVAAGDAAGTVFMSTDDGTTWRTAATDLPGINCVAFV